MKTSLWQRILAKFLAKRQISAAERQYDAELTYTGRTSDAVQNERRDYVAAQLLTVSRLEEIYRDSDTLIRTTTNPKTFFERYDDAKNVLQKMLEYAVPAGIQAGEIEKRLRALEREREQLTLSFIDRSIRAGKRALLQDTMWRYADRLTARSAVYLQSALGQPKRNTDTEYFYCAVAFTPGGKSYYYRTEDSSLRRGDRVLVPTGPNSKEAVGVIQHTGSYRENTVPFPLESTRIIIGKCDKNGTLI